MFPSTISGSNIHSRNSCHNFRIVPFVLAMTFFISLFLSFMFSSLPDPTIPDQVYGKGSPYVEQNLELYAKIYAEMGKLSYNGLSTCPYVQWFVDLSLRTMVCRLVCTFDCVVYHFIQSRFRYLRRNSPPVE